MASVDWRHLQSFRVGKFRPLIGIRGKSHERLSDLPIGHLEVGEEPHVYEERRNRSLPYLFFEQTVLMMLGEDLGYFSVEDTSTFLGDESERAVEFSKYQINYESIRGLLPSHHWPLSAEAYSAFQFGITLREQLSDPYILYLSDAIQHNDYMFRPDVLSINPDIIWSMLTDGKPTATGQVTASSALMVGFIRIIDFLANFEAVFSIFDGQFEQRDPSYVLVGVFLAQAYEWHLNLNNAQVSERFNILGARFFDLCRSVFAENRTSGLGWSENESRVALQRLVANWMSWTQPPAGVTANDAIA